MRIMVGAALHGRRSRKDPGFSAPAEPCALRPFTLNRASNVYWSWWAVCCSRWASSRAPLPFVPQGQIWAVAYFMVHAPRDVFPLLSAGSWRSSTRSSSSISGSPRAANGALIEYASPHPHPPYRQARPEPSGRRQPNAVDNFRGAAGGAQPALRAMPEAGEAPSIPSPRG